MKITIEIDECADYGLTPYTVYRKLSQEYSDEMRKRHNKKFLGMWYECGEVARQLYAQIKNRPANVKSLILTYQDAENVFNLFKQFADVWAQNYMESKKNE